jgi:hypothetical protein
MRVAPAVLIPLSLAVAASPASALTIDNFEEGPFSVSALDHAEDIQTGLSTLNVISGQRFVGVGGNTETATTAHLALTGGDDAAILTGNASEFPSVDFAYEFDSPFDLTQGGSLDRFLVDLVQSSHMTFRFSVTNRALSFTFSTPLIGPLPNIPQVVTIPYSAFTIGSGAPLDLTQVDALVIRCLFSDVSISNIAAVTEPSTALLLGCGLLGLAGWRRARA